MNQQLTRERLRQLLHYDAATGVFTWLINRKGGVRAGDVAGSKGSHGYLATGLNGKLYLNHRLAWLYMTGEWPQEQIDHRNCDKLDNRWLNLRGATRGQNNANSKKSITNTSGLKNVSWHKPTNKWRSYIWVNNKQRHLGLFDFKEEAHNVYRAAATELRGEFARFE